MSKNSVSSIIFASFLLVLTACAAQSVPNKRELGDSPNTARVLLLGEVHDNQNGHEARLKFAQKHKLDSASDLTLVLEHINRDQLFGKAFPNEQCKDKSCLVQAIENSGWNSTFYLPWLDLALENNWQVLPGNISKADIGGIMSSDVPSTFPKLSVLFGLHDSNQLPEAYRESLTQSMVDGHCGLIGEKSAWKMGQIQIARDVWMASQIEKGLESSQRVIVLTGNGHIEKGLGIPFWLARINRNDYHVVAFLEGDIESVPVAYDQVYTVDPAEREDPCKGLREHFKKSSMTPNG